MKKKYKSSTLITVKSLVPAALIATVSVLLSYPVAAQMAPQCGEDPSKPGACFIYEPYGTIVFFCDDGAVVLGPAIDANRAFGRENPNGTMAVHDTAALAPGGACPTADFPICGTPDAPGPGVFLGEASLQSNGFVTSEGLSCPFKATIKGTFFRDVGYGPEEAEVDTVVHLVKDKNSPGGCRLQQCRIFSPDNGS